MDILFSFCSLFLPFRCVFMRLTSIGVLLFSLWSQITDCEEEPCKCGYNHVLYSVSHANSGLLVAVCPL